MFSFECEPILNEHSRPAYLEDVVTSDSDDSISLEEPGHVEALLATCSAEPDFRMSCLNSSGVESISNSASINENSDVPSTSISAMASTSLSVSTAITSIVHNNDIGFVKRETVLPDSTMAQLLNNPTRLTKHTLRKIGCRNIHSSLGHLQKMEHIVFCTPT